MAAPRPQRRSRGPARGRRRGPGGRSRRGDGPDRRRGRALLRPRRARAPGRGGRRNPRGRTCSRGTGTCGARRSAPVPAAPVPARLPETVAVASPEIAVLAPAAPARTTRKRVAAEDHGSSRSGRDARGAAGEGRTAEGHLEPVRVPGDRPDRAAVHRRAAHAEPQGRRHQGHAPEVQRADEPQHRPRPRRPRDRHGLAHGHPLGPGPRAHPEDQRARVRARGERDADRRDAEAGARKRRAGSRFSRRRRTTVRRRRSSRSSRTRRRTRPPRRRRRSCRRGATSSWTRARTSSSSGSFRSTSRRSSTSSRASTPPVPQVMIEARIVEATRTFSKRLGHRLGLQRGRGPDDGKHDRPDLPEQRRRSPGPSRCRTAPRSSGRASGTSSTRSASTWP